jgi:hypothetical protein
MCTLVLATVARDQCPNRPGLTAEFSLGFTTDITSIGAATDHSVATITMVATKVFYRIAASRKESSLETVPNENGGFTTTAKYFITRQQAAKAKIFNSINATEALIAVVTDQNGEDQILGSLAHPVMVTVKPTVTPRNGYELTITWEEHSDLPFFFTGSLTY